MRLPSLLFCVLQVSGLLFAAGWTLLCFGIGPYLLSYTRANAPDKRLGPFPYFLICTGPAGPLMLMALLPVDGIWILLLNDLGFIAEVKGFMTRRAHTSSI